MSYEIIFPYPPKELSPNYRPPSKKERVKKRLKTIGPLWRIKSVVSRQMRSDCFWLTRKQVTAEHAFNIGLAAEKEKINVYITFYPPDRRGRDVDNALSSAKSLLDGMAEAIGINDKRFLLHPEISSDLGNIVKVRIEI